MVVDSVLTLGFDIISTALCEWHCFYVVMMAAHLDIPKGRERGCQKNPLMNDLGMTLGGWIGGYCVEVWS